MCSGRRRAISSGRATWWPVVFGRRPWPRGGRDREAPETIPVAMGGESARACARGRARAFLTAVDQLRTAQLGRGGDDAKPGRDPDIVVNRAGGERERA